MKTQVAKPFLTSLKICLATLFLVLAFLAGRVSSSANLNIAKSSQNEDDDRGAQIREGGFKFINPLLECEVAQNAEFKELTLLRASVINRIEDLKKKGVTHVSLYFRDLNNGPWIGINEKEQFRPASLAKVPVLIAYLKNSESSPSLLYKEAMFKEEINQMPQFFKPKNEIQPNIRYTVNDLLVRMIKFSDNKATQLLVSMATDEELITPFRELGLTTPDVNSDFEIRVKDYATFFRVLFNAAYLNKHNSEMALELLTSTEFRDGLVAGVPSDIQVAHKFGEREFDASQEKQLHDCGVIYYPGHPYLLCVMTRGKDFPTLTTAIKDLSKLVYSEVDAQARK